MRLLAIFRFPGWENGLTLKTIRVMKLTAILLFFSFLQVSARSLGQTVTLKVKNAPVKEVFKKIQKQTGFNVLVDEDILEKAGKVTLDVQDMPVTDVLKLCFKNESVNFSITDGRIVVRQATTKSVSPAIVAEPPPPLFIEIKGRVTDEKGEVPPGVTVTEKGKKMQ